MSRRHQAIAVIMAWWLGCAATLRAAELHDELSRLFAWGEKNTPSAVAAAKESYEKMKRRSPRDSRLEYAFAAVLTNQHKYAEAEALVVRLGKERPWDYALERTKIWLDLQQRRYPQSLDHAVQLAKRLSEETTWPSDERLRVAELLGTVVGYIEQVRPAAVDLKLRNERKNAILSHLSESETESFDAGRQFVADRLAALQEEQQQRQQRVAKQQGQKQQQAKSALEKDQESRVNEEAAVNFSQDQLRETGRELTLIQTQLRSLANDRVKLAAQIAYYQALFDRETGAVTQTNRPRVTSAPSSGALSAGNALFSLSRQAVQMDRRILELRRRAAELGAKGEEETQNLAESEASLRKAERRAAALEKQLRRSEAKDSNTPAKPAAMTSKMTALSTYWPFPYEEERQRVLAWFADE